MKKPKENSLLTERASNRAVDSQDREKIAMGCFNQYRRRGN